MTAKPDAASLLPHRIETRKHLGAPWGTYLVCSDRSAAVERVRQLMRFTSSDCIRIAPITPRPGSGGPRLIPDDRTALRHALADGRLTTTTLSHALADGGTRSTATRKRASDCIRRLRDVGLIAAHEAALGPGAHVLTAEGRRAAAELGDPAADAA